MLAATTIAIALLALGSSAWFWARALRGFLAWRRSTRDPDPVEWPQAHVFVCLKGRLPGIEQTLGALQAQDYPARYRVTFVTEAGAEQGDEAARDLAKWLPGAPDCDHVIAGRVLERDVRCAQKNFNLLAGIRHADEVHPGAEVFAFCDGDLLVKSSWLREMIRPIAVRASEASTSFHWVAAEGRRIVEALHGLAEAAQSMAALVCRGATWGGSMAIRASTFHEYRLHEMWGRTVVDDMALSRAMKRRRLRVAPVPRFLVQSTSEIQGYGGFVKWLARQYFFVKVYQPSLYWMLWMKTALDVASIWSGCLHLFWWIFLREWPAGATVGWIAIATAFVNVSSTHLYRFLLPERPSARAWMPAALLAPGASFLACASAALRRRRLTWRDLTYVVERDGSVRGVTLTNPEIDRPLAEEAA
ncbi:MAG: ceramide glucosyltransferase [Gemmatimonadota bacterium]|nr:MAG: ceramide glucosyltransferase [Gemmatimonadota bacterium]